MLRWKGRILLATLLAISINGVGLGEQFDPAEPFAAVDQQPVLHGEIDLLLSRKLKVRDPQSVPIPLRRATAMVIVRQHLALKTLLAKGGQSIRAEIDSQLAQRQADLKRRGSSIDSLAKQAKVPADAMIADFRWKHAWQRYLKSRLTDQNLRRFFQLHKQNYGGRRHFVSHLVLKNQQQENQPDETPSPMQRLESIASDIRQSEDAESEFISVLQTTNLGPRIEPFWVSAPGDLPRSVYRVVQQSPPGELVGPVQSPLGAHLVFVHKLEEIEVAFDDLTDHAQLRNDATIALFEQLIREQSQAKVQWFVDELKPRDGEPLIP